MGMGEPLANLDAVLAAVDIMCHPQGLQLSHKKVCSGAQPCVPQQLVHLRRCASPRRAVLRAGVLLSCSRH